MTEQPAPYRDTDCPNCGRHRVQDDGVCEKCLWDADGGDYAAITRPTDYTANGRIYHLPENEFFREMGG